MPPPTESVVDADVSGDDFHGGTTLAFGADDPVDGSPFTLSDSDRLAYMEDVFEASTDNVSVWKSVPYFPGRIETNGADNRMLQTMKSSVHPVLMKSCQLVNKQLPSMKPADFVSIFLNRDWYPPRDFGSPTCLDSAVHLFNYRQKPFQRCIRMVHPDSAYPHFLRKVFFYFPKTRCQSSYNRRQRRNKRHIDGRSSRKSLGFLQPTQQHYFQNRDPCCQHRA